MTPDELRASLADAAPPPGLSLAVQALWWEARGDWNRAHDCAQQDEESPDCCAVHAYLHRREGDPGNAGYWYRRAGRKPARGGLDAEWAALASEFLST